MPTVQWESPDRTGGDVEYDLPKHRKAKVGAVSMESAVIVCEGCLWCANCGKHLICGSFVCIFFVVHIELYFSVIF